MLDVKRNLTTMTDFYELTMSAGYLDEGYQDKVAVFDMFFRRVPDGGGYAIMAGLQQFIDAVDHLEFTEEESCGKCTPCRVGTKRLSELLKDITQGKGTMEHIAELKRLSQVIKDTALCGLGQTAPNPVLSTLAAFEDEYIAHVNGHCPAGKCTALLKFYIDPEKCKGCTLCARNCPVNAIEGTVRNPHSILQEKCIKCGTCMDKCKFGAIVKK